VLMEGVPGRSYAFEMAERVGVHPSILKRARRKMGDDALNSEKLLKQLEEKVSSLEKLADENRRKEQELNKLRADYEIRNNDIKANRQQLIQNAKKEAAALVQAANRDIERTIREIRESQAEQAKTKELREKLMQTLAQAQSEDEDGKNEANDEGTSAQTKATAGKIAQKEGQKSPKDGARPKNKPVEIDQTPVILSGVPAVGDSIKFTTSEMTGQLVDLQGTRAVVLVGDVRMNVKLNQLIKISPPRQIAERAGSSFSVKKASQAKIEIDVMGKRVEEVFPLIEGFIDEALYAGLQSVSILHGKGTGALKAAIRSHLRTIRQVVRFGDAPEDMGGAGWTLVELKPE